MPIAFRWVRPVGEEQHKSNSTLVEFTLAAEGDQTRLTVVESGFRELAWSEDKKANYAAENTQGWQLELDQLDQYISKHVRPASRHPLSARFYSTSALVCGLLVF